MKRIILFILTCVLILDSNAQTIKDYLKTCPTDIVMSLDSAAFSNISNLLEKGSYKGYITIFGDSVSMNQPNDNFITFEYSNVKVQVKIIDDAIVVSKTIGDEIKESELFFFDKEWNFKSSWIYGCKHSKMMPRDKEIYAELIVKPDTIDSSDFERLKTYPDPLLVSAELSEDTDEIILKPYCPLLTRDEKAELEPILKQKTFKWTNGKFK